MKGKLLLSLLILMPFLTIAQKDVKSSIYGKVVDGNGSPLDLVNVSVPSLSLGVMSNERGQYELTLPHDTLVEVFFSFIGYNTEKRLIRLKLGEERKLDVTLVSSSTTLPDAVVYDRQLSTSSLTRLDAKQATLLPSMGGSGVEDLIKTLPGVVTNNELSSQYRVRGGNFDENLVYVNGIEIYRPFLTGSWQQDGLSFINSRLVSNVEFSAGGFAAEYGDKMSSVLDVTYKAPVETAGSLSLSLLGAEAHVEGTVGKDKFSYLLGTRYKNTKLVLGMMDTKGHYNPNFTDVQGLFTYNISPKFDISFLGYYSRNHYGLVPETATTDFGVVNDAHRLTIYFDGKESDNYSSGLGAMTFNFSPSQDLNLKLIASAYSAYETETYDIQGQYFIGEIETDLGSEQAGNVITNRGVGTYIDHARNSFYARVFNLDHKGTYILGSNVLKWGLRYQQQLIDDVVDEWNMVDSAGYNLPHVLDSIGVAHFMLPSLELTSVHKTNNRLSISNFDGFIQESWTYEEEGGAEWILTGGLRANFWGYNKKIYFSPRLGVAYRPNKGHDIAFRLSGGVYNQVPFYREIRNLDGSLFADARPQQSYQAIMGCDYRFKAWERPFIFSSEVFYKYFSHIIPYDVDNVRIRYYADQQAKGYATGIDFKVNGEFVKGIDSWASLSFLRTREDIQGDYYLVNEEGKRIAFGSPASMVADTIMNGWHDRPSDQWLSFSLFFQDYIPRFPSWRVHMTLIFGSGMPVNRSDSPFYEPFRDYPWYRRVDIGFSKQLINEGSSFRKGNPLNHVKNMWINFEVFNLLNINNTVSYTWITDVDNRKHAVNSYLTPRYLNLKLVMEF